MKRSEKNDTFINKNKMNDIYCKPPITSPTETQVHTQLYSKYGVEKFDLPVHTCGLWKVNIFQ